MANNVLTTSKLEVTITQKTCVKAVGSQPEPHIIMLSNLDLLSGRFPITYLYLYRKSQSHDHTWLLDNLKVSLGKTLAHFFPFAGQIWHNAVTDALEIVCENTGALVVEGNANISLQELDFYDMDSYLRKLVCVEEGYLVRVQITKFQCGSLAIAFTFDHALGDASAFGKFLISWSEMARDIPVSCIPNHQRNLKARTPPCYDFSMDKIFATCNMEQIKNLPTMEVVIKRLYYVENSSINYLQKIASRENHKRTKIEAFSAYIWKIMAKVINQKNKRCKMGWLVDGRRRMGEGQNSMANFIGNLLSVTIGEASVSELNQGSISDIATVVHESISKATNEDHFLDLIDWVECHKPGMMLPRIMFGNEGPTTLVVSSGQKFPVGELDLGFGNPVLGTTCSTIERIGIGYVNQRQSARGDGSWVVSAILWPELALALESDTNHVFQPMSADYLQLQSGECTLPLI